MLNPKIWVASDEKTGFQGLKTSRLGGRKGLSHLPSTPKLESMAPSHAG